MKGIEYQQGCHLNFANGFAKFLQKAWNEYADDNSAFGNQPTKHELNEELESQIQDAVLQQKLVDYQHNVKHIQMIFLFGCRKYLLFRGVDVSICNGFVIFLFFCFLTVMLYLCIGKHYKLQFFHFKVGTYSRNDRKVSWPAIFGIGCISGQNKKIISELSYLCCRY